MNFSRLLQFYCELLMLVRAGASVKLGVKCGPYGLSFSPTLRSQISVSSRPPVSLRATGSLSLSIRSTSGQSASDFSPRLPWPVFSIGTPASGIFVNRGRCMRMCEIVLQARETDFIEQHTSSPHSALQSAHQDGSVILFGTPDRSGRGRPLLIPSTNNTHEPSLKDRTNERCDKAS